MRHSFNIEIQNFDIETMVYRVSFGFLGELLNRDKFPQYGLPAPPIEWANGADFAPEFLHDIGVV